MTPKVAATAIVYVVAFTILLLCGIHFAVAAPDDMSGKLMRDIPPQDWELLANAHRLPPDAIACWQIIRVHRAMICITRHEWDRIHRADVQR